MSDKVFLPGGGWRLWSHFALRGAGFPAAGVLRLAPHGLAAAADAFAAGAQLSGPDWEAFAGRFDAAAVDTARVLQQIAASPAFRAALAWQNRGILHSGIAPFLAWTPSAATRTSMPRQREELVAHYWQRLCVKNDTIGFFGPVGWGRLDTAQRGLSVDPGHDLIASSRVYFSAWCVDTLAKAIDTDPRLRPWTAPRRVAFLRLGTGTVTMPGRGTEAVTPLCQDVLRLCDGTRPAFVIEQSFAGRAEPEQVRAILSDLAARRWIRWRLEVPAGTHPDQQLRAVLERVGDPAVRSTALAGLDRLVYHRDQVQQANGAAELDTALAELESAFIELTGAAAQREKGARTAPNRALVYSDCRRSATARVGTAVLDELTALQLCLTSARWMTCRFAAVISARITDTFRRLRAGGGAVDLGSLWFACLPAPHPRSMADIEAIQAELRERWARIIDAPSGARRVQLSSAAIAAQVHEAFADTGPDWSLARYISPDLMIIAEDFAAVERGEFELVIGELHVAMNTVAASLFVNQHPDPAQLVDETSTDFPVARLVPVLPKEMPRKWSVRSRPALDRPQDYHVAIVDEGADPHRPRTVNCADVHVEERDGRLVAVLPDGAVFDVLDAFSHAMTARVMDRFALRPDADHCPRVTVDKVVVAREMWRWPASTLTFAQEKNEARRFVRARGWRQSGQLPRFVFVVSPAEPRPFFVDFDSPVYVNIFCKAVRRLARQDPAARVTLTEMLPTPEQAWLTDDQGQAYSCELRLVAVAE